MPDLAATARELYDALAAGDRPRIVELLHPDFVGHTAEGLPFDLGGTYRGADEMLSRFWGRVARHYDARAEMQEASQSGSDRLVVSGVYRGTARSTGAPLEATFVHELEFKENRLIGLRQHTDTQRWHQPLEPNRHRFTLERMGGLAILTLDNPDARNVIDLAFAVELLRFARELAESPPRALLIQANGDWFTPGGDVASFATVEDRSLASLIHEMLESYHDALRLLSELPCPVVTAVQGAVGGGGLGLVYVADVALAADPTVFATGFATLGLSCDGASSWFLPRLVGPRRAVELLLEGRQLDAHEAAEWGLVSRAVPAGELRAEARAVAERFARGPTTALGAMRTLMRESWDHDLRSHFAREIAAIRGCATTSDAAHGVTSFMQKTRPTFEGQ